MKNIITLKNGTKIANFSSPHEFKFDDGYVLQAVSNEESERLKVTFIEKEDEDFPEDIHLSFELSHAVLEELNIWMGYDGALLVDVVLIPLPMMTALKEIYGPKWVKMSPFRCVRIQDRINKLVCSNKFCL